MTAVLLRRVVKAVFCVGAKILEGCTANFSQEKCWR